MSAIIDTLAATLQAAPDSWQCRLALVEALCAEDRADEAYHVLSQVDELPADEESFFMAAKAYGLLDPSSGIEVLDQQIAEDPTCARAYLEKAYLYERAGDPEAAYKQYTAALTFDPSLNDADLETRLGLVVATAPSVAEPIAVAPISEELETTHAPVDIAEEAAVATPEPVAQPPAPPPLTEGDYHEPLDRSQVYYPAPGEIPTMTLREALNVPTPVPLVNPEAIPALPELAYQEEVQHAEAYYTPEQQFLENVNNVELQPVTYEEAVVYDYQQPDKTLFEPTLTEDEIYVGALVTETGEPVANLQETVRRNKKIKEDERTRAERIAKLQSIMVGILVTVGICFLMVLVVTAVPRPKPPQIVANSLGPVAEDVMENQVMQRQKTTPTPASSASAMSMDVMTVAAASDFSTMNFDTPTSDLGALTMSSSFGASMSFGDEGSGMVSFFGSKTNAQKVVFVVDASASMKAKGSTGKTKLDLMKEELIRTVQTLPAGLEFQILFFSGPSWFLGEDPKREKKDWTKHKSGKNFWEYRGGDPDKWPTKKYIKVTQSKIRSAVKDIEATGMELGTDWRDPLKMAMKMQPDTIYFMTDGAVGKHPDKPPVVEDVLDFNKKNSKAKINTVCLMVLKAADNLKELADKTKGEMTLVLEDGTSVRGRDLDKMMRK